ncbi:MAG: hypothetical protein AAB839_00720 [Patescibacteria group bacterium]
MPTDAEKSIFRILAYFAHFRFPLTLLEIQKWSDGDARPAGDIEHVLSSSVWLREQGLQSFDGFWALGDVVVWRQERIMRMTDALRKSRKLTKIARVMARIPWVRMVALCNSLAFAFTNESSDIDVFIVTSQKRIWSTRLVIAGTLALLRARPGERAKDPLCLSFFVTDDALDLSSMKIGPEDPYMAMWIATLAPVIHRDETLTKMRAANAWIRRDVPHAPRVQRAAVYSVRQTWTLPDVPFFERIAERVQRSRLPAHLRTMMNHDTRVVITDRMLKFHHNDRREEILNAWRSRCQAAGV